MATEREILNCLGTLTTAFPESQTNLSNEKKIKTFSLYCQMLADLPRDALQEATIRHVRESKFFPKISELREMTHLVMREKRARPTALALPTPPPTPDERAAVKKLIAQLAEKFSISPTPEALSDKAEERRELLRKQAELLTQENDDGNPTMH